jgi:hypothetical protein
MAKASQSSGVVMDSFQLETIGQLHAVSTDLFVPFVIRRLAQPGGPLEAILDVTLEGIVGPGSERRSLQLLWSPQSVPGLPPPVPATTVTEWAALGIACVVLWRYAGARLSEVTLFGDRFDYWVNRGDERLGLEVSGTVDEDVRARHRDKVRQWRANPYQADGFVVVVGFNARQAIFSYHRFAEENDDKRNGPF